MHGLRSRVETSLAGARDELMASRARYARTPVSLSKLIFSLWPPLVLLALAPLSRAIAQQSTRSSFPPLELRVDAIDVRSVNSGTLQGGIGANVPLGIYVRLEIDGAGGVTRRDSVDHNSARVDAIVR